MSETAGSRQIDQEQPHVEVLKGRSHLALEAKRPRRRSFETLDRLRRHPSAVIGGVVLMIVILAAVLAPLIAPVDPLQTRPTLARQPPSTEHWLGTDRLGRDLFSRVIYGGRISLMLGLIAVAIGGILGTLMGLFSGFFRGPTDLILMQINDILLAFPGFLLALAAVAVLGTGIYNVMVAVGISLIPTFARVIRGATLTTRDIEYVQAARVIGAGSSRILFRHVTPNVVAPAMVLATVGVAGAILTGAALSFLGLGAEPPTPEWGLMINEGRSVLRLAWWVSTFPGIAIMIVVIGINLFGDAVRDVLDPRLRT